MKDNLIAKLEKKEEEMSKVDTNANNDVNTNINTTRSLNYENSINEITNTEMIGEQNQTNMLNQNTPINNDNINNNEQAGDKETRAKQVALNKFRSMGEISITENDLNVITVMRKGIEHYYIETRLNNLEIEASTGKITKVNNNPVE